MINFYRRMTAFVVAIGLVGLVSFAAPAAPTSVGAQEPTATPIPEGAIPCDPSASRTISPRVVEAGGEVDVTFRYTFNCTGEDRRINVFLVVENTSYLRGPRSQALANVKEGLLRFVNQVNYLNGSKGGLTLYAENYSNRVTLVDGPEGKQALLEAIGRISAEPIGNSAGAGPAIRDATGRLPTGEEDPDVTNVLFVVDAGAPVTTQPGITLATACHAAEEAGVHVMVVGLELARYLMAGCATNGWARYDPSPDANGFPDIADELAEALVKGQKADSAEVLEALSSAVTMLPGAQPFEPDNPFANDFSWTFQGNPPPTGQEVRFRIKITDPEVSNEIFSPSFVSDLTLFYNNGTFRILQLPKDDICVYQAGHPEFCDGFPPEPETPTSTPTESPTPDGTQATPTATVGTTETPTDTPTDDTPSPTPTATDSNVVTIYLPATVKKAPLTGGG
jgi:hypothetical protein